MLDSLAVDERPLLRWGVNLQAGMYADAAAREAQLARLATLGVTIARISMPWSWVETAAGHMDWRYADQIVADLERHGIKPLVEISNMPGWARPSGTPESHGPTTDSERDGFAKHCGAVAARFKGRVYAYEIWNEANGGPWSPTPNLNHYSLLFEQAYAAIKAVDPEGPVISTGLAGICGHYDPIPWVREFVKTPAMALADGFGLHPYSDGDGLVSGLLRDTAFIRQILDEAGYSHVPMYMTEAGISTGGSRGVSEAIQAKIVDVTADWLSMLHGVNCVLWYCDMDSAAKQAANPNDFEGYFGLYRKDGSAKPAATAFANQIKKNLPAGTVQATWFSHDGDNFVPLVSETA